MTMQILAPVKNLISGVELINAGAEEIYFGVVSREWEGKHGYKSILNRRDGALANISSYEEWKKLVDFARSRGVHAFVTLNNSPVIPDFDMIRAEIRQTISMGPDALIVKDLLIADLIREIDPDIAIHCSSLNQVINKEGIAYWRERANITRMILPRNVNVHEIRDLATAFPDLEFEIFIKNDWCYDSDGICSSLHLEWLKDGIPYVCNREFRYKNSDSEFSSAFIELLKKSLDCKVCMLYELQDIPNIVSLKIVGREKALQILLRDVQFVKGVREYMAVSENFLEFAHFNIAYHSKIIHRECGNQNCEVYKMQLAKIPW